MVYDSKTKVQVWQGRDCVIQHKFNIHSLIPTSFCTSLQLTAVFKKQLQFLCERMVCYIHI